MKWTLLTLVFALGSCTAGRKDATKSAKAAEASKESDKSSAESEPKGLSVKKDDDALVVPVNIAGAFLTCAVRKEATNQSLEAEIGCQLTDSITGKKVSPDAKLSFSNSAPTLVTSEIQSDASIYNVLYRIKGESKDAILQQRQSLDAVVFYAEVNIKTQNISKVLKPAIELADYEAPVIREQAIDKDDGGSL